MRNNWKNLFYIFTIILILSLSLFIIPGCSNKGGAGNSASTGDSLTSTLVAESNNKSGTFEAKIYCPELLSGKLILPETKHIVFTVTGQGLTSERTAQVAYGTTTVTITNLPAGTKTAEVKAVDGNGATLTHRIVAFTITSGQTTTTDIVLGVSITDNGYIPQSVKISPNDTLIFVNSSAATSHSATADDGTFNTGVLAVGGSYPQQFTSAGIFNYHDSQNLAQRGTITVYSPPSISSLSATSGNAGDSITITGTSFGATQGASTLTFNGIVAVVTSWSDTSIVCNVPSASTGNIVVIVNNQASSGSPFTINSPYISAISPNSGLVGASITINGYNFGAAQGSSKVSFNGKDVASYTSWSAIKIVCLVPSGATTGPLTVTVGDIVSNGVTFTVQAPAYFGTGADGDLTLAGSFNINTETNQGGRVQGDGVNFSVTASVAAFQNQITLASTPNGLAAGDEILIINLQNTSGSASVVGKYETAIIDSVNVDTKVLTLKTSLVNSYDGTTKKIMVQRIPQYDTVTVNSGGILTASAWDGTKGGVVFVRCKTALTINSGGKVSAKEIGFRRGEAGTSFAENYIDASTGATSGADGSTTGGGIGGYGGNGNSLVSISGGTGGGCTGHAAGGVGGTNCGGGGGGSDDSAYAGGGGAGMVITSQPTDSECLKIYLGGGASPGGGGGGGNSIGGPSGSGGNVNGSGGAGSGAGSISAYALPYTGTGRGGGIAVVYAKSVTINSGGSIDTGTDGKGGVGGAGGNGANEAGGGGGAGGCGASGGVIYLGYQTITGNTSTNVIARAGNGGDGGSGGLGWLGGGTPGAGGTAGYYNGSWVLQDPTAGSNGSTLANGGPGGGGAGGPAGTAGVTKTQALE